MISILNEYFNILPTLDRPADLLFNGQLYKKFNYAILNYNVNKNSKITNSKLYFILMLNFKWELETLFREYIKSCENSDHVKVANDTFENWCNDAKEYVEYKRQKYRNEHSKFKLLKEIEDKYNVQNKDNLFVSFQC